MGPQIYESNHGGLNCASLTSVAFVSCLFISSLSRLGYDQIRGNPRGSESNGLDPGFRYRVIRLRQVQSDLTVDGEYTVPLGTDIKVREKAVE